MDSLKLVQIILFCFSALILIIGIYLAVSKTKRNNTVAIILIVNATILSLVASIDPTTITALTYETKGISLCRHIPSLEEREEVIEASRDEVIVDEDKINSLVESTKQRVDQERSQSDYLLLASKEWRNKNYEEALVYAYDGLKLPVVDRRTLATLTHRLATIYFDLGINNLAIKRFKEAINIDTSFSWPHSSLGRVYASQKKYDEAETEIKEAIRLDPNEAGFHSNLGNVYHIQKKYDEAETEYKEAIRLNPNEARYHGNLGNVYHSRNQYEEAAKECKEAIRLDPNEAAFHSNLGDVYCSQNQYDKAEKEFEEAIRLNPNEAGFHSNLGMLYNMIGEHEKAKKELELVKKLIQEGNSS